MIQQQELAELRSEVEAAKQVPSDGMVVQSGSLPVSYPFIRPFNRGYNYPIYNW